MPLDTLVAILRWLQVEDLLALELTCRELHALLRDNDIFFKPAYGSTHFHRWPYGTSSGSGTSFRQLALEKYKRERSSSDWTAQDILRSLLGEKYLSSNEDRMPLAQKMTLSLNCQGRNIEQGKEALAATLMAQRRITEAYKIYQNIEQETGLLPPKTLLTAARFGWPSEYLPCLRESRYRAQALIGAARSGCVERIQELVAEGTCLSSYALSHSAATAAAKGGHENVLKYLVAERLNICIPVGRRERLPLWEAAEAGHVDATKYILSLGSTTEEHRIRACEIAIRYGNMDILKLMVGSCCNTMDKAAQLVLLRAACASDQTAGLTYVIEEVGIDMNSIMEDGKTAIHCVAELNKLEHVTALLTMGVNIHREDASGQTPLAIASKYGFMELVKVLSPSTEEQISYSISLQRQKQHDVCKIWQSFRPLLFGGLLSNLEKQWKGVSLKQTTLIETTWNEMEMDSKMSTIWLSWLSPKSLRSLRITLVESDLWNSFQHLYLTCIASRSLVSGWACPHGQLGRAKATTWNFGLGLFPPLSFEAPCCLQTRFGNAILNIQPDHLLRMEQFLNTPAGRHLVAASGAKAHSENVVYAEFQQSVLSKCTNKDAQYDSAEARTNRRKKYKLTNKLRALLYHQKFVLGQ